MSTRTPGLGSPASSPLPVTQLDAWLGQPALSCIALLGLCALLYLPGLFTIPPIDRDEARFAEATRQMVVTGAWDDIIVPKNQDRPRLNKPPLIYWLQAPFVAILGGGHTGWADIPATPHLPTAHIWMYRLPSVLAATLSVLLTWLLGRRLFAPLVATLGAALLAASLVVVVDAHLARADQVLLLWTTLTQSALWRIWQQRHGPPASTRGWALVFWLALGLGVMTKGPITPAVAVLTVLALSYTTRDWRWIRRLHPLLGPLLPLAMILPWLWLVAQAVGVDRIALIVARETAGRGVMSIDGHGKFPGFYTLLAPITLWPASLALVPAFWLAARRALALPPAAPASSVTARLRNLWTRWQQRQPRRPAELFLLAWILPSWMMFECLATRLPHYTLPLYPAICLLCARAVLSRRAWDWLLSARLGHAALQAWVGLSVVLLVGLPIALAWAGAWSPPGTGHVAAAVALLVATLVLLVFLVRAAARQRFVAAQLLAVASAVVLHVGVFQLVLPHLDRIWISPRIVQHLQAVDPDADQPAAALGYREDSLMFLTAGGVARLDENELPAWRTDHPHGRVLTAEPPATQRPPVVSGFNYSNGEWVELWFVDAESVARPSASSPAQGEADPPRNPPPRDPAP